MSSFVDILRSDPATVILMDAIAASGRVREVYHKCRTNASDGAKSVAQVHVTVNGVEVDFETCLQAGVNRMVANYQRDVHAAAKKLLSSSRLSDLVYALDMAQARIEEEIEKLE